MKAQLYTQSGGFVANAPLPPQFYQNPPDVLLWGQRIFHRPRPGQYVSVEEHEGKPVYVESFFWVVIPEGLPGALPSPVACRYCGSALTKEEIEASKHVAENLKDYPEQMGDFNPCCSGCYIDLMSK